MARVGSSRGIYQRGLMVRTVGKGSVWEGKEWRVAVERILASAGHRVRRVQEAEVRV